MSATAITVGRHSPTRVPMSCNSSLIRVQSRTMWRTEVFGGWRGPGCPSWRCVALPGKQRMSGAFLALLAAACADPYRCETIGLDGREAEAHGTLEVTFRDWKLSTERVFLTSRNRGSGVSMSACDDHDGDVRMFR